MIPKKTSLFIRLLQKQQRKSAWVRLVCVLAVVVSIGVVYALMQPAITMDNDLVCGMEEHTHTEECYELQDGEQVLVCGQEEHIHDERCLAAAMKQDEPVTQYYCGFGYEHQHDPTCYVDGELVCTLKQHTHSTACLDPSSQQSAQEEPIAQMQASNSNSNQEQQTEQLSELSPELLPEQNENNSNEEILSMPGDQELEPGLVSTTNNYDNIRDHPEANISFSIRVGENPVDLNHFYGEGIYSLNINNVELPSYEGNIYYLKLDARGFDLYYGDKKNSCKIQDLSQEQPGSEASVLFWAEKDADGYYTLFFQPKPGAEVVYKILLGGYAISDRERTYLKIHKESEWNSSELAFGYDITVNVPAYTNFCNQAYFIADRTKISSEVSYSPFASASFVKDFTATIQTGGQSVQPLRPIQEVWQDPGVQVAYYERNGTIFLMNRTSHEGGCLTTSPTTEYPGWCSCWSQPEESVVHISYVDVYAQSFFEVHPGKPLINRVIASCPDSGEVYSEVRNTIPVLLDKKFNPLNKQCTIVINEGLQALSGSLRIKDQMENVCFNGNIKIVAADETTEFVLTAGDDYIFEEQPDGFLLTICDASRYVYTITYNVEKLNGTETNLPAKNSVQINNSKLSKSIDMNLDFIIDPGSYGCQVSVIKTYGLEYADDGTLLRCANPPEGAEFGLFNSNGELLATSKTENGRRFIISKSGRVLQSGQSTYNAGDERDIISFNSESGIRSGRLFFIQETKVPPGYLADDTKYFFFVTSFPEADSVVQPVTSVTFDGIDYNVEVFDNWNLVPNETISGVYYYFLSDKFMAGSAERQINNEKYFYVLPETGGIGTAPYLIGGCFLLFMSSLCLLFTKHRKRRT